MAYRFSYLTGYFPYLVHSPDDVVPVNHDAVFIILQVSHKFNYRAAPIVPYNSVRNVKVARNALEVANKVFAVKTLAFKLFFDIF